MTKEQRQQCFSFLDSKKAEIAAWQDQMDLLESLLTKEKSLMEKLKSFDGAGPFNEERLQELTSYERLIRQEKLDIEKEEDRYKKLQVVVSEEEETQKFLMLLLDTLMKKYIQTLEVSLNEVFEHVFENPEKKVRLVMVERRGKSTLELSVVKSGVNAEDIEVDLGNSGGSVTTILGTILDIYYIIFNRLPRIIFFDETFSTLEDGVLGRFFEMLRTFVDEMGFRFFCVSHDPRIMEYADKLYEALPGRIIESNRGIK